MMSPDLKQDLLQLQIDQTNFMIKVKAFLEKHPEVARGLEFNFHKSSDEIPTVLMWLMGNDNEEQLIGHIEYAIRGSK